jgi:hypothetical protein
VTQTPRGPLAERLQRPVECTAVVMEAERLFVPLVDRKGSGLEDKPLNEDRDDIPPAVHSGAPDKEMEQDLKRHPHDLDKKADVGSDQSMDASDPPAAAQPGQNDDPVPSSSFPE